MEGSECGHWLLGEVETYYPTHADRGALDTALSVLADGLGVVRPGDIPTVAHNYSRQISC